MSRWGVVSFADSLDCVAVMAANVFDAKRIFSEVFPLTRLLCLILTISRFYFGI